MQRNFIARYLKERGDKDNALVAFYHEGLEDWRFSYVKRDYKLTEAENGKVNVKEELSSARRLSFLVGKNEPSHTAQQQLVPILQDDKHNPTLQQLEQAFNIETVTKEFYEKYRQLYLELKEELDQLVVKDEKIKDEFSTKSISSENFAKKLLGQIVFLYFLQKKGWMGIEKDERGIYKSWGTGPKNFLRKLFSKDYIDYGNFFDEVLEPLFYQALRIDRGEVSEFSQFNCKIPFLNGGLFEPTGDYSWEETRVLINNETIGEILDTFDLYNFTVKEDEPLDKEVAVDPEMLGKVFENLLEVKDRKSKGTYYTPREIVHYMCQESLISYLDTTLNNQNVELIESNPIQKLLGNPEPEQKSLQTNKYNLVVPKQDIEYFIRKGEAAVEHDLRVESEGRETRDYSYRMPESIRRNAKLIDEALVSVQICDPAVGSGAFPVGMMQEIIKARGILTTYIGESTYRNSYDFKRHCIQESLYGVDIDPSAVDIAKLRLWLSLIVDEDDFGTIKPLPNLDYKIVCGNSLLGIERNLRNWELLRELELLKRQYFEETSIRRKPDLKHKIDSLIKVITNSEQIFDFEVYFSEVFHENHGFDVVIGNPPYLRIQGIKKYNPELADKYKKLFQSATGSYDLYVLFSEKGLRILNKTGILNYIMPHKWINSSFGYGLRNIVLKGKHLRKFISFGSHQVFNASNYTSLIWLTKHQNKVSFYYSIESDVSNNYDLEEALKNLSEDKFYNIDIQNLGIDSWVFPNTYVRGILDKLKEQPLRLKDVFVRVFQGIATGKDSVFMLENCRAVNSRLEGFSKELGKYVSFETEFLKPILKGELVHKYAKLQTNIFVIFPYKLVNQKAVAMNEEFIQHHYPLSYNYLKTNEYVLRARENGRFDNNREWFLYSRKQGINEVEQTKIITPEISLGTNMTYDEGYFYHNTKCYSLVKDSSVKEDYKFYLAILNSRLMWFFLKSTGYVLRGGYYTFNTRYLEPFPLPKLPDLTDQEPLVNLVDLIFSLTKDNDYNNNNNNSGMQAQVKKYEYQINQMVYDLYGLTKEEISIVEEKV